ncbi:hypothetical protein BGX34_008019 [Mortierella sp. NVP85]|nr:hypothetical protein BGX34_008019 [Mortierella sp. NVP85]
MQDRTAVTSTHSPHLSPRAKAANAFRDAVAALGGEFDENIGCVEVVLRSKLQADLFYQELEKARSVYELKLLLDWEATQSNLKSLRDTIVKTNVRVLELHLSQQESSTWNTLFSGKRCAHLFDIMGNPSIQSVTIHGVPAHFFTRSRLHSRKGDFPNLRFVGLSSKYLEDGLSGSMTLVTKSPNLSSVAIRGYDNYSRRGCIANAQYHSCPVSFPIQSFCIFTRMDKSPRSTTDTKDMSDLLNGAETAVLANKWLDDSIVAGLAKAIENGSRLKDLTVDMVRRDLSEHCIKDLASTVAGSGLREFSIYLKEDDGYLHILEPIRWEHLCD